MMKIINKIEAKSIITNSGIPGADFVINPYTGCLHGCKYCYADFMNRFTGHTEEWGSYIDAKVNAPALCAKEAKNKKPGVVMFSSVTDCYNPAESDLCLTRECLQNLPKDKFSLSILSKSALASRDIDIFKQFRHIEIGLSFSSHRTEDREIWEPGASNPDEKALTLKKLHDAGIKTYLFISPILPGITEMEEIIKLNLGNFDTIMAEALNLTPKVKAKILPIIKQKYPQLIEVYGSDLDDYWQKKYAEYRSLIKKYHLESTGFHRHGMSIQE